MSHFAGITNRPTNYMFVLKQSEVQQFMCPLYMYSLVTVFTCLIKLVIFGLVGTNNATGYLGGCISYFCLHNFN